MPMRPSPSRRVIVRSERTTSAILWRSMLGVLSMVDQYPNARLRERRRQRRRRQVRIRRAVALAVLLAIAAGITLGARAVGGDGDSTAKSEPEQAARDTAEPAKPQAGQRQVPDEIRGVHVTMALASLPGKLREYLAMPGLNTIELDVKDENGEVGFAPRSVPLASKVGAARRYYNAEKVAREVHASGDYLIGRIVTFEDPVLSEERPDLADERRPRLGEPVRPSRVALQRRSRGRRREGRLRRDPVRLRPLSERRRPLADSLPRKAHAVDGLDDPGLRAVRRQAAAAARRARLRRRVRALGDP